MTANLSNSNCFKLQLHQSVFQSYPRLRAELRKEVSMKPVRELFEEALTFQATGAEPSEIARRIIDIAHASGHVIVNETSSAADIELGFSGSEKIRWDGREWRFYAN